MGSGELEILMRESPQTIGRHAVVAVHHGNAVTGECPYWDPVSAMLWWIDIQGQRLLAFDPTYGRMSEYNLPSMPGLLVGRRAGGLLLGLEDGLYPFSAEHGLGERLVAVEADDPRTRINDGRADARGRLWFGTMDKSGSGTPIGSLYRFSHDDGLVQMRDCVRVPNAINFSPDCSTFYFCDSRTHQVEAMPYDISAGSAGASRTFVAYAEPHSPDGTCIDSEGCVWISVVGAARLERRRPDGTLDTIVELPVTRPTMATLGGPDGRTLYITSQRRFLSAEALAREPLAGDLLAVHVDVAAFPPSLADL